MEIELNRLTEVDKKDIIELMNNPLVRKHMPLATGEFNEGECDKFISAKEKLWKEHGYGPWALIVNGSFVGWGGLQPEAEETEIALVLHPKSWGMGKIFYKKIIHYAFKVLNLDSIIALFPPSRNRIKGLTRLGFKADGACKIEGASFLRYRISASQATCSGFN